MTTTLIYVVVSLALVALNGFFVAAEFAIVKVRRSRLEELVGQGVAAARVSILCVDQLDEYLSATQLGITLVSLGLGWIGEDAFYNLFRLLLPNLPLGIAAYHTIAIGTSFFLITLLHVVLGELVPKSMAIQKAEKITLKVATPLRWFYKLALPLIHSFTVLANLVLRVLGFHGLEEPPLSEEELKIVMKESHEEGVITESEAQIINRAFEFSDKPVSQIMVPKDKVQFISLARSIEDNLDVTRKRLFTRFPLSKDGIDNVIGIIHMKDALNALGRERTNRAFEISLRPAVFVPPGTRQDKVMKLMNEQRTHMAIVRDPATQKVLGLVTLEDILEELVGEIRDEHGN
jgi:CBS domain containing-hemolysin-like protein